MQTLSDCNNPLRAVRGHSVDEKNWVLRPFAHGVSSYTLMSWSVGAHSMSKQLVAPKPASALIDE